MITSGHFADTHGLTGYEPNLTNSRLLVAWAGTENCYGAPSLEKYTISKRKHTLTIIGTYWQSNMFTAESKADTL